MWNPWGISQKHQLCSKSVLNWEKKCLRKLSLHLLSLFKLLLTLMLKHCHPQVRLGNSALCNDRWQKTPSCTSSVFCFALILIFRCTVSAVHLHNQETMWTHKREGKKRACCQGRDAACQNKHLGSTSKATNWLFLSSLSFSCVLEINHSWMFLK